MGVLKWIVLWPLAPVRGVVSLGELIQRRVDQEMQNPATTRKQLEGLEEARKRGELSPEEEEEAQEEIVETKVAPRRPDPTPTEDG